MLVQQAGQKSWTCETTVPHPAQRGGSAKSSTGRPSAAANAMTIANLVAEAKPPHKRR